MPFAGNSPLTDYHILLRRGEEGARARLYPFNLADLIPCFPLPLQAGDEEPIVDFNKLLQQIYREASYHLRLDYTKLPVPPLQEDKQKWAEQILQTAKIN